MIYLQLFLSFLQIGLFSFGGVIWEIVIKSVNSVIVSQSCCDTTCSWIRGIAA